MSTIQCWTINFETMAATREVDDSKHKCAASLVVLQYFYGISSIQSFSIQLFADYDENFALLF